ncbi:hypothetical protein [Streptomyces sp. NPDC053367]|uniref:hypothetical protein n=1 Tax=Streptomyces sp. NPDC053367 TaxID=3365700 RepID=UPI0037D8BB9C
MNDDVLLARLRAADPALTSSAPPPDIDRLVEAAVTTDTTPRTAEPARGSANPPARTTVGGGGRRHLGLAAAAAVLVAGAAVAWQVTADSAPQHQQARISSSVTLTPEAVDTDAPAAQCAEPTVETLRKYPTAFKGTVTSHNGDGVAFRIDHWFRGGKATSARLISDHGNADAWTFEVGRSYLVTADHGVVPACGGTDHATKKAEMLFRLAFEH